MATGDAPPQRTALADELLLAHELVQRPRPHPRGQRLGLGRWLEQRLWAGAGGTTGSGHDPPMVARWAAATARGSAADQLVPTGPAPVAWVRTQIAINRIRSEPPIKAIRRMSRMT